MYVFVRYVCMRFVMCVRRSLRCYVSRDVCIPLVGVV